MHLERLTQMVKSRSRIILRWSLSDYRDARILLKRTIKPTGVEAHAAVRQVHKKKKTSETVWFTDCISKKKNNT